MAFGENRQGRSVVPTLLSSFLLMLKGKKKGGGVRVQAKHVRRETNKGKEKYI